MAVFLEFNYGKRWGLPAYSSHSFSITLRSEVGDLKDVEAEACRVYALLQESVDRNIIETGLTPVPLGTGSAPEPRTTGHSTDQPRANGHTSSSDREFKCSDKQRDFFLRFIEEKKIDKRDVEKLSQEMFNAPVLTLDKLAMSGLISELLSKYGETKSTSGNGSGRRQYQRGGARQ